MKLEMRNSEFQTKPSEVSLTNGLIGKEESISGLKDKIEEKDCSIKENVKSKNIQA